MPDEQILHSKPEKPSSKASSPRVALTACGAAPAQAKSAGSATRASTKDDLEMQIEFAHEAADGVDKYHLHIRCNAAWEFERNKAGEAPQRTTSCQ
jgi:hypothetical protein